MDYEQPVYCDVLSTERPPVPPRRIPRNGASTSDQYSKRCFPSKTKLSTKELVLSVSTACFAVLSIGLLVMYFITIEKYKNCQCELTKNETKLHAYEKRAKINQTKFVAQDNGEKINETKMVIPRKGGNTNETKLVAQPKGDKSNVSEGSCSSFTIQMADDRYGFVRRSKKSLRILVLTKKYNPTRFRILPSKVIEEVESRRCLNLASQTNEEIILTSDCRGSASSTWHLDSSMQWLIHNKTAKCLSPWSNFKDQDDDYIPGLNKCAEYNKIIISFSCHKN